MMTDIKNNIESVFNLEEILWKRLSMIGNC